MRARSTALLHGWRPRGPWQGSSCIPKTHGAYDVLSRVACELVTNAVRHAHPPYGNLVATRFERLGAGIRIEVHDASEVKPEPKDVSTYAESGRGLALVNALTGGRWGVSDREGPGKLVWAVVGAGDGTEVSR